MTNISLKCKCGAVEGSVSHVSPQVGNHIVCYCDDCQAFANHLSTSANILDEWGGTEVYQTAPWHINIHKGIEQLQCLRLTPKGLYRWYTGCCNTPVGNAISAKFPFVGLIHAFIDKDEQTGSLLGPVMGYHKLESAKGKVPESFQNTGMSMGTTMRVVWRIFKWKLTAGNKPNLFFKESGQSISKPEILRTEPG
jgi:hypothetical protein